MRTLNVTYIFWHFYVFSNRNPYCSLRQSSHQRNMAHDLALMWYRLNTAVTTDYTNITVTVVKQHVPNTDATWWIGYQWVTRTFSDDNNLSVLLAWLGLVNVQNRTKNRFWVHPHWLWYIFFPYPVMSTFITILNASTVIQTFMFSMRDTKYMLNSGWSFIVKEFCYKGNVWESG
jgi:hypothetical protein